MDIYAKLEDVERKFEDLTDRLSSPGLLPKDLQSLAKEQAALRETVEVYRAYKKAKIELQGNREILNEEKDAELKELAKIEIESLQASLLHLEDQLTILLLPKDPLDEKNTILEFRAGTGGEEAALFAQDLFRM